MVQLEGFTDCSRMLKSGVYALCAKGDVIYVGKSKAMIARIAAHRTKYIDKRRGRKGSDFLPIPGLMFDQIWVLPVEPHRLDEVEAEMINRYKPRYNIQLKNGLKVDLPSLVINGIDLLAVREPAPGPQITRRI